MHRRSSTLCSILIVTVLLLTCSYAWSAKAVATSKTDIYMLDSGGTSAKCIVNWNDPLFTPANLAGIKTKGNLMYVADESATGPLLHVLQITGNNTATRINTIELKQGSTAISIPKNLSLDASGGVYVHGENSYAYVNPVTSAVSVSYVGSNSNYAPLIDIATFATGAVIVHKDQTDGPDSDVSHASSVTGASTINTQVLSDNTTKNYTPIAVAVHPDVAVNPLAYVLNRFGAASRPNFGTVTVVDAATSAPAYGLSSSNFNLAEGMIPLDITAFTTTLGIKCIGIVAIRENNLPNNNQEVWRYELNSDGRIKLSDPLKYFLPGTYSQNHKLEFSPDGNALWITNEAAKTVDVLNADTWLPLVDQLSLGGNANYIADWDGIVPEPSSFIAFLTFATGMFGLVRKRRMR